MQTGCVQENKSNPSPSINYDETLSSDEYHSDDIKPITPDALETIENFEIDSCYNFLELSQYCIEAMPPSDSHSVIFEVEEYYPIEKQIECRFLISSIVEMRKGDKIGIFPLNWNEEDPAICISSKSPYSCTTDSFPHKIRKIIFDFDDEIDSQVKLGYPYQFCYLDEDGKIIGKSSPFTFYYRNDDYIDLPEANEKAPEEGFVVVKSTHSVLMDKLKELSLSNGYLEHELKLTHKKISQLIQKSIDCKCTEMKAKIEELKKKLSSMNTEKEHIDKCFKETNQYLKEKETQLILKTNELIEVNKLLQDNISKFSEKRQSSEEMINYLQKKIAELIEKEEQTNKSHSLEIEEMKQQKEKDESMIGSLNEKIKQNKREYSNKIDQLGVENEQLKRRLEKAKKLYEDLYKEKEQMKAKITKMESKLEKYKTMKVKNEQTSVKTLANEEPSKEKSFNLPCVIPECNETFICSMDNLETLIFHLENVHKKKMCPICSQLFEEDVSEYFLLHVENHFEIPDELN